MAQFAQLLLIVSMLKHKTHINSNTQAHNATHINSNTQGNTGTQRIKYNGDNAT